MRPIPWLLAMLVCPWFQVSLFAEDGDLKPLATSGKAEIVAMRLERSVDADVRAKPKKSGGLAIHLWLPSTNVERQGPWMIRFVEFGPAYDNRGELISSDELFDKTPGRLGWVTHAENKIDGRKAGPLLKLSLLAPAREATTIRSLKGKVVVAKPKFSAMAFKDPLQMKDAPLEHALLKDFPIRVTAKLVKDSPDPKVIMDLEFVPPHSRIVNWGLAKEGKLLRFDAGLLGDLKQTKTYSQAQTDNSLLAIIVQDPVDEEVFEFDFRDLELP